MRFCLHLRCCDINKFRLWLIKKRIPNFICVLNNLTARLHRIFQIASQNTHLSLFLRIYQYNRIKPFVLIYLGITVFLTFWRKFQQMFMKTLSTYDQFLKIFWLLGNIYHIWHFYFFLINFDETFPLGFKTLKI